MYELPFTIAVEILEISNYTLDSDAVVRSSLKGEVSWGSCPLLLKIGSQRLHVAIAVTI